MKLVLAGDLSLSSPSSRAVLALLSKEGDLLLVTLKSLSIVF